MAQESIFQARLFDAVACGTRMVSDYVEGVEELFQGAVKTWRTAEEFAYLCSPKGYKEFPSDDEMLRIAQYVQTEHSFDQRADVIVDAALNTRRNNTRQ
jgi:spore maturation protein CgeB